MRYLLECSREWLNGYEAADTTTRSIDETNTTVSCNFSCTRRAVIKGMSDDQ